MAGVNYGGVLGGMINTDVALEQLQGQRMENAQNAFKLKQEAEQADIMAKSRLALQEEMRRQAAEERTNAGGMPKSLPTPDELALTEGTDQPGTGGGSSLMQSGGETKLSDLHLKEYKKELGLARATGAAGDVKSNLAHSKAADEALAKGTAARNEERKEQKEKWQNILNYITGATDQASLNDIIATAKTQYPDIPDLLDKMGVAKGADGKYKWEGSANPQKIKALGSMVLTELDRVKREEIAANQRRLEEESKDREAHRRAQEQQARANEQLHRDSLEARNTAQRESKELREANQATKVGQNAQRSLERDPAYKDFSKYEIVYDRARALQSALNQPDGYAKNAKPSEIRQLAVDFRNMAEGFRTHAGGENSLKTMRNDFNGVFDKFGKYFDTFGRGSNDLSEQAARDVVNTITQGFDIANKAALLASFSSIEQVSKQKGDTNSIKIKGDLQRAIKTGQAWETVKDGKSYINIGNNKPGEFKSFELTGD